MKIDFITNVAPHYREHLWLMLANDREFSPRFVFGTNSKSTIHTMRFSDDKWIAHSEKLVLVRNWYLRKVLVWQSTVVGNAFRTKAQASVFLGDMYVMSTWIAVLLLKVRGKKVIFWGHGMYGNEKPLRKFIRLNFLKMANINLVYGERARKLLIAAGLPADRVRVVYNSLDYEAQKALRPESICKEFYANLSLFEQPELPILIFVGRLTKQKKLDQLINVVIKLNRTEVRYNLIFVGDGPERLALEESAQKMRAFVHFHGPCYDEDRLAKLIANADLCVAPGEVGLSAVHCLGYGTPICTHGNMSEQMPEAEAVIDMRTGVLCDQTEEGIYESIESWFNTIQSRESVRQMCYEIVDKKYNPSNQVRVFRQAFRDLAASWGGS